jgi:DNA-binding FrmR family transcriptional regulator
LHIALVQTTVVKGVKDIFFRRVLTAATAAYIIGGRGISHIIRRCAMKHCIDVEAVVNRLKRIEGQVRGLINMVENDKSCEDILIQIGSAKSALHKTGQVILEGHLHHCVLDAIRDGNEDETIKKLSSAIEQFSRIV